MNDFPLLTKSIHLIISIYSNIKKFSSYPIVSLVAWWTICLYFKLIVFDLFPLALLIWLSFKWNDTYQDNEDRATLLNEYMTTMESVLQQTMEKHFSWSKGNGRSSFIYLVYAYIFWISLQQVFSLSTLFIAIGSAVIIWKSDWLNPFKTTIKTMRHRFTRDSKNDRLWTRLEQYEQEQSPPFLFELFENQRLNVFTGQWEGTTLPFERSAWTDSAHFPISSKSQIVLPLNGWKWMENDWSLDTSESADDEGWSYGTIIWTKFHPKKDKKRWYDNKTRRRKWTRKACITDDEEYITSRRSSVFYSQQLGRRSPSAVELGTADTTAIISHNAPPNRRHSSNLADSITPKISSVLPLTPRFSALSKEQDMTQNEEIPPTPLLVLKPQHEDINVDEGIILKSRRQSTTESIISTDNSSSSNKQSRRTKRLFSSTRKNTKDAIWKSIGQQHQ